MLHTFVCKLCTWSFKLLVTFCNFFRDMLQTSKESRPLWRHWYVSLWHRETEKPPQPGFQLSTRGLALCVIIGSIWYTRTHLVLLRETAGAKHRADIFGRAPQATHFEHMVLWLIDRADMHSTVEEFLAIISYVEYPIKPAQDQKSKIF
jgi:hypothetical protein